MLKLVIQDDEGKTTVVPLIRDEVTIGRKEGNTIRLTERNVSRNHARIERADGTIVIEDLGSYNGVRVNGSRIQGKCGLNVSDRVKIGDYLLELKQEASEEDAPSNGAVAAPTDDTETVKMETVTSPPKTQELKTLNSEDVEDVEEEDSDTGLTHKAAPASTAKPTAQLHPITQEDDSLTAQPDEPTQKMEALPARLVVLSHDLPQREFALTGDTVTIGRTDDNDIVIEHRSISRNHAKIVLANNRYSIEDLGSANGIHVNGEEYERVELRRGDIVELGHVRVRYVEAGEDYVVPEVVPIVDESAPKSRKFIAIAIVGLALVAGVLILMSRPSEDPEPKAAGIAPADAMDATSAVALASMDAGATGLDLISTARSALEQGNWETAKVQATLALKQDPHNQEAQDIVDSANAEMTHQKSKAALEQAIVDKRYTELGSLLAKIPSSSKYYEEANAAYKSAREDYVRGIERQADQYAENATCAPINRLQTRTSKIALQWKELGGILQSAQTKCARKRQLAMASSSRSVTRSSSSRRSTSSVATTSSRSSVSSSVADVGPTADQLLKEAKEAAQRAQFSTALRKCKAALAKRAGDDTIVTICAISACNLKNASAAKKYINMLRSQSRQTYAKQICWNNGIEI